MSVVNDQGANILRSEERPGEMNAHRWRRDLKDVGDQALMRGYYPHFRFSSRGCPCLTTGIDHGRPQSGRREFPCRDPAPAGARMNAGVGRTIRRAVPLGRPPT